MWRLKGLKRSCHDRDISHNGFLNYAFSPYNNGLTYWRLMGLSSYL